MCVSAGDPRPALREAGILLTCERDRRCFREAPPSGEGHWLVRRADPLLRPLARVGGLAGVNPGSAPLLLLSGTNQPGGILTRRLNHLS